MATGSVIKDWGRTKDGAAGYTLVELMVVVAILGLLAVVATPQVIRYLGTAKVGTAKAEVDNLAAALDLFRIDVGRYPTNEEGLAALVADPPGVAHWGGPYIKRAASLIDPWGHPFNYRIPGEHGEFDLFSFGPDGETVKNAQEPVIANW